MTRRGAAWAILALWVAGIVWLLSRTYRNAGRATQATPVSVNPGGAFLSLTIPGGQVGVSSTSVDTLGAEINVQDFLLLDAPGLAGPARTTTRTAATLTRALELTRFTTSVSDEGEPYTLRGAVDGDSLLRVVLVRDRDSTALRAGLPGPVVLPQHLPLVLGLRPRRPGDTARVAVFDPIQLMVGQVEAVAGLESTFVVADSAAFDSTTRRWAPARWDTVPARRFDLVGPGVPRTLWVDPEGNVARAIAAAGVVATREAFELAYENYRRAPRGPSLLTLGRPLNPSVARPGFAGESLRVVIAGTDLDGLHGLEGVWQHRVGDTVVVQRAQLVRFAVGPLPRGSGDWALAQVTDPRIRAQARQVVAGARGQVALSRLVTWVHTNLRRAAPPTSLPTASEVLAARYGGPNEHVVLLVALAEANAIPARPVTGILYAGGTFYYHAWAEAWLGEWVPVDPLLGQVPADAGHLRLGVGRLATAPELVHLIGSVSVRVP